MLLSNREFFGNLLDDGHTLFMGRNEFSVAISLVLGRLITIITFFHIL
jgi:hypothetical protein